MTFWLRLPEVVVGVVLLSSFLITTPLVYVLRRVRLLDR